MTNLFGYKCSLCGAEYGPDQVEYVCPHHGDRGNLDVVLDYGAIGRDWSPSRIAASPDRSIWRYAPLLPVQVPAGSQPPNSASPLFSVGWTPVYRADRLAADLGLECLYVKDEGRNPTASFKDRASAVAVARALEVGAKTVTTASSGNAAAALAGMAASVQVPTVIFVPQAAPQAKVAQLLMFGARVFLVNGTYDDAFDLTLRASREFGWYCRNTGYNPFTLEGKKTAAFEICEQLSAVGSPTPKGRSAGSEFTWKAADRIFVSVGDGNIISGIHKGLKELRTLGWIEKMPRLMGVQAAGAPAVYEAWKTSGEDIEHYAADTIADSISVGLPRDGVRAVRAARETGGAYLTVTDDEILDAMRALARRGAVFAEPAGATGYAGLVKAVREGMIGVKEIVVVVVTGNGLKDVKSAMRAAGEAVRIGPNLEEVRRMMKEWAGEAP